MDWISTAYWVAIASVTLFTLLITWQAFEHRRYCRSRSRHRPRQTIHQHLALFVPCKGLDADLEANLRPLFEQDHEDYEIVFIVESECDPACAAIDRVMAEYPGVPSRRVVAGISEGTGQKVHNLLVATEELPKDIDVLVFVDADVRPPRDWLRSLTSRMHREHVSTGYRCFVPKRNTLPNLILSALNGSVVPIMFPGKHHLIWGGSWAITRETFLESGLREAWKGTLSDDLIATRVMAAAGRRVSAEPMCILPSPLDVSWSEMLGFVRRQLIIGRCYTAVHWYALLFGTAVMQTVYWGSLAALAWGLAGGAEWTWRPAVALAVVYTLHVWRAYLRHNASQYYLPYRQDDLAVARRFDTWLGPVAGVFGLVGLVSSAFTRRIVWKGIAYDMEAGGAIRQIVRPPQPAVAPAGAALGESSSSRRAA